MKKHLIIFTAFFSTLLISAQDIDSIHMNKYEKAFEYIQNDSINSQKKIYVSNLILNNVPRDIFMQFLKPYPTYLEKIKKICSFRMSNEYRSDRLKEIFAENNSVRYFNNFLFFSTIDENTLIGDVFLNVNKIYSPNELSKLDSSSFWFHPDKNYVYLFFFDEKNEIEKVFCSEFYGL